MTLKIGLVFPIPYKVSALWPSDDYDFEARKDELTKMIEKSFPDISFVPVGLHNLNETEAFLEETGYLDGFIIYFIGGGVAPLIVPIAPRIAKTGKPVILVDDLYSGQLFLVTYPRLKEAGFHVIGVASSVFEDVLDKVKLLRVIEKMRKARILLLTLKDRDIVYYNRNVQECASAIKQLFGTELVRMNEEEFIEKYLTKVSDEESEAMAEKWINKALRVVEPTHEDLVRSAKLYHALRRAIKDVGADAFTTDIPELWHYTTNVKGDYAILEMYSKMFGLDKIRPTEKYQHRGLPCLAYFELNNEGIMAVCESDIEATVITLLVHYLTEEMIGEGIPGFTSEPVVDQNKGWLIYGHCTSSSKVFGPNGSENSFVIRSHSESHHYASVQSLLPIGEKVTVARIDLLNKVMTVHGGVAVANSETLDVERGCRTKLAVRVDVETIMKNWTRKTSTWHRTVFYGDWKEPIKNLATLLGIEVFEEDRA